MLSATQEACQAELEVAASTCSTSHQAAASVQLLGQHLQGEDWQEVVYKASCMQIAALCNNQLPEPVIA